MPFLLRRCLNNRSIKDNIIQRIKENNQLRLNSQAISMIKQCWIKFAICSKAVFAESMSDNDYVRLDATLQNLSIDLLKVFPEEFSNLPNLHVLRHLSEHARRFGNLINASVSLKEMVHRIYKSYVPHTNKKNVELDFIKRENTLQSLRYLIDRGLHNHIQINGKIKSLFDGWYLTSQVYSNEDIEEGIISNYDF
uniref:Uncharacterized protein n=1 Tax=Rhizophagus irregularis (strain DAOM 181602 / DAOM 197198 / MUCL 43194) TaxID=747089 RepID=U9UZT3_RHIID